MSYPSASVDPLLPSLNYVAMGAKPDPFKFDVIKRHIVHGNTIVLARYHGCLTYHGLKLMLLRGEQEIGETLDPHFLTDDHAVIARFVPTDEGWKMAEWCAAIVE